MEQNEQKKSMQVSEDTWKKISDLRGHNGCISIDDVIQYLYGLLGTKE